MTADPFKLIKEVQKGLKKLSEKFVKAKNPNFRKMGKRLSEIDTKMSEKFWVKKKQDKNEDQS